MPGASILQFPRPASDSLRLSIDLPQEHGLSLSELQLSNRLHRQLELQQLFEQFLFEVRDSSPIVGLCYTAPGSSEVFLAGCDGRASVSSSLRFNGEYLGEIEILLSADLKASVNRTLAPLGSPLFNALRHHRLKQLARKDWLTGLGNRLALEAVLATEVARAQRFGHPFALLLVDIDHFKRINDSHGHSAGDRVILAVAEEIRSCLRPYDQAFRYGGEEFVVVLSQTGLAKGLQIAERIRGRVASRCGIVGAPGVDTTVSIGGAEFRVSETTSELFDRADRALYDAKNAGRNRVVAAD